MTLKSARVISEDLNDANEEYVEYQFTKPVVNVPEADAFELSGYSTAGSVQAKDVRIVHGDTNAILAGYQAGTDVRGFTIATVKSGAVVDESGRINMRSSVALTGANSHKTLAIDSPMLKTVTRNNTLDQVVYTFDQNLNTDASTVTAGDFGYYDRSGQEVPASSIITIDNNQVTAQFDQHVRNAVRYVVDSSAVTDARTGLGNIADSIGSMTSAPTLTAVSTLIGRTQFDFTFNMPVSDVTAKDFVVYTADGAAHPGSSAVRPSANVVEVAFPEIQKYGSTITVATAMQGAVQATNGSSVPSVTGTVVLGQESGLTAGPDLTAVMVNRTTGQARYQFDKTINDNKTYDPSNFALITSAGTVVQAKGFVEVSGSSVLLNFDPADASAAVAASVSSGAVQTFDGSQSPATHQMVHAGTK